MVKKLVESLVLRTACDVAGIPGGATLQWRNQYASFGWKIFFRTEILALHEIVRVLKPPCIAQGCQVRFWRRQPLPSSDESG